MKNQARGPRLCEIAHQIFLKESARNIHTRTSIFVQLLVCGIRWIHSGFVRPNGFKVDIRKGPDQIQDLVAMRRSRERSLTEKLAYAGPVGADFEGRGDGRGHPFS